MSKKFVDIGELRQRDVKDENGKVLGKKSYVVLGDNVKVLVGSYNKETKQVENYREVDLGQYRTVNLADPKAGLDALLNQGYINEGEHEQRLNRITEKNIKYKLTVPPTSK